MMESAFGSRLKLSLECSRHRSQVRRQSSVDEPVGAPHSLEAADLRYASAETSRASDVCAPRCRSIRHRALHRLRARRGRIQPTRCRFSSRRIEACPCLRRLQSGATRRSTLAFPRVRSSLHVRDLRRPSLRRVPSPLLELRRADGGAALSIPPPREEQLTAHTCAARKGSATRRSWEGTIPTYEAR